MTQTEMIELRFAPPSLRGERFRSESRGRITGDSLVVALPPQMRAVLVREALRTGRTSEGLMREAIARYLTSLPPVLLD